MAQDSESHNDIQHYNDMESDVLEGNHHHDTAEGEYHTSCGMCEISDRYLETLNVPPSNDHTQDT
jgi:hypothetical protein